MLANIRRENTPPSERLQCTHWDHKIAF